MTNETKNDRRERFLRAYANLPLNTRKEVILMLEMLEEKNEKGEVIKQPITWEVAYLEVRNNTSKSEKILEKLDKLKLI
ncbi:MAG: hypothetical protein COT33_03055 [Candidatus Nealsonbacteria bacterium CG08_land_8_20_14_0_20_38_20]|uniref:Uncharacterized protein n=1 Tax=Candidatus Nealsonbacteria bacterium CG08_land_8_20_14_0_20_38_20 TaxID=1974705 RepID=A0A2H0YL44_9BACT|nr:MAG: hypothetical protein COT33_03055 [Candidatus Nealsonbacteria bacterium CG08_land_8_20_14_0_20_38_20]